MLCVECTAMGDQGKESRREFSIGRGDAALSIRALALGFDWPRSGVCDRGESERAERVREW